MLKAWQFRELNQDIGGGVFDKMINLVSIVEGVDYETIANKKPKELIELYKKAQELCRLDLNNKDQIKIKNKTLTLINMNMLSLGQFIHLESLVNECEKKNVSKIAACLYVQTTGGNMIDLDYEPYEKINVDFRAGEIDELHINDIWGAVVKYLKFRKSFFDSYEIFNDPYKDVNVEKLTDEEKEIYNEEMNAREKTKGRQYENILNILSNKRLIDFPEILRMNLFLCFNQLSFLQSETE